MQFDVEVIKQQPLKQAFHVEVVAPLVKAATPSVTAPRRRRIIMLTATWCVYCDPTKDAAIAALKGSPEPWIFDASTRAHVQLLDVDTPEGQAFIARYGAVSYPEFLLMDGDVVETRGTWQTCVEKFTGQKLPQPVANQPAVQSTQQLQSVQTKTYRVGPLRRMFGKN